MTELAQAERQEVSAARELHAEIVKGCEAIRRAWVYVAGRLYEMHDGDRWRLLGHRTWGAYCASEGVGISRAHADLLVRAWRVFVIEGGVAPTQLDRVDLTKVSYVLPAIGDGRLAPAEALAAIRTMRREELRNLYVLDPRREPGHRRCPNCGFALGAA